MRGPPYWRSASKRKRPPDTFTVAISPTSSMVQVLLLSLYVTTLGTDVFGTDASSGPSLEHAAIGAMAVCPIVTEPALPSATASPGAACAGTVISAMPSALRHATLSVLRRVMQRGDA